MYAVIETGGKQHRVAPGDVLDVELLDDKEQVTFDNVLLFADDGTVEIGTPHLKDIKVVAKVLGNNQDDTVTTFT